jgi:membrane protein implicated in regulation of membrane protease activity
MWQFWLILAGVFFIIEIITVGFLVFWFSIGALIAMIASLFIKNFVVQASIFVISSFVAKITQKDKVVKTNVYSVEGKVAKVVVDVEPVEGKGQIKVDGELWSAKSYNDTFISKDTEVLIEKIDGVKAIVKPLN